MPLVDLGDVDGLEVGAEDALRRAGLLHLGDQADGRAAGQGGEEIARRRRGGQLPAKRLRGDARPAAATSRRFWATIWSRMGHEQG